MSAEEDPAVAPPLDEDEECFPRPPRPSLSPLLRPMRFIFDFSAQTWRFLCVVEGHGNQSEGFPHLVSKVKATNPPRSLPLYCRAEQRAPERCEGGLAEMGSQPLRVAKKVALGFPLLHRVPAGQGVGWRSLAPSTSLPPGLAPELAVPLSSASLSSLFAFSVLTYSSFFSSAYITCLCSLSLLRLQF